MRCRWRVYAQPPDLLSLDVEGEATECVRVVGERSQNGAIVLLSDIYGINEQETQAAAARIADMTNSTVYCPDIFRGEPWPKDKEAGTPAFEEWRQSIPDRWPVKVGLACSNFATGEGATSVAAVGFCLGGGRLVELLASTASPDQARDDPLAAKWVGGVAYYGTRIDPDQLRQSKHPVKLIFGGEDPLVSKEQIGTLQGVEHELCKSGLFCDVQVFEGQPHGFVHLNGAGDEDARERALQSGVDFLMALL